MRLIDTAQLIPLKFQPVNQMTPFDLAAWEPWTPTILAERLQGLACEWYVVGGWALDLWHGQQTRSHHDLEFVVAPQDACRVAAHLTELAFFASSKSCLTHCAFDGPVEDDAWQFWGGDVKHGVWRVDMMMERGTPQDWHYKRDPSVQQPRHDAIRTNDDGIAYLAPANILLFKAKHCRPKDELDFANALPNLSSKDKQTLCGWLQKLHPEHKWIPALR